MQLTRLLYPLRPQILSTITLAWLIALILKACGQFFDSLGSVGTLLFWRYTLFATLTYGYLLFEYGMDVLESSAWNRPPPVLRSSLNSDALLSPFTVGDLRFLKQALLAILCLGFAQKLHATGYTVPAVLLLIWLFICWPASMLVNSLFNSLRGMLNPLILLRNIRSIGLPYLPLLLLMNAAWVIGILSLSTDLLVFSLLFPPVLYCWFLALHLLGDTVYRRHDRFFTVVDFGAERKALASASEQLDEFNHCASSAYELLRAGRRQDAQQQLESWLDRNQWTQFDLAFRYLRDWPDRSIALALSRRQLSLLAARNQPLRALELLDWCLEADPQFSFGTVAELHQLSQAGVLPSQHRLLVRCLRNLAAVSGEDNIRKQALQLARDTAGHSLHDEGLFAELDSEIRVLMNE